MPSRFCSISLLSFCLLNMTISLPRGCSRNYQRSVVTIKGLVVKGMDSHFYSAVLCREIVCSGTDYICQICTRASIVALRLRHGKFLSWLSMKREGAAVDKSAGQVVCTACRWTIIRMPGHSHWHITILHLFSTPYSSGYDWNDALMRRQPGWQTGDADGRIRGR